MEGGRGGGGRERERERERGEGEGEGEREREGKRDGERGAGRLMTKQSSHQTTQAKGFKLKGYKKSHYKD